MTKILKGENAILEGARLIKNNDIIAFPTETVYGLGGNAYSELAIEKIFKAKNRPCDNPLIVHIACINDIWNISSEVKDEALMLLNKFSPGPLTVVLKKNTDIPNVVTAGLNTVGIRIPQHKDALSLIQLANLPIAAPSANLSTRLSPTTAQAVFEDLKDRVELIIDGGGSNIGIESTVIDLTSKTPTILRPGFITLKMIQSVLKNAQIYSKRESQEILPSPGMRHKHYAPLVEFSIMNNIDAVILKYQSYVKCNLNSVIVCKESSLPLYKNYNTYSLGENNIDIAKNIFNALRVLEKKYQAIISESFDNDELGFAIMNRLNKAASNN